MFSFFILLAWQNAWAVNLDVGNFIKSDNLPSLIESVSGAIVKVGIPFAVFAFMIGGFRFVYSSARGDEAGLKSAKELLQWTIVGSIIVVGAAALVYAVVNFAKTL